ncbi:MAG: alpha/beta hydrolase [Thermodesulfobacteriota bacterium]
MPDQSLKVMSDGLELQVEAFGDGRPFLFAHSLGGCRHQARRLLEPLASEFRVIVFDQRGHCGSTPVTDPALYEPRRMAGDVAAVLDGLGVAQAIVGGESMGAATTLLFATMHPKRVQHVVQVAPTVGDEPNPSRQMIVAVGDFAAEYGLDAAADAIALASMSQGIPREAARLVTEIWSHHRLESFVAANRAVPNWVLFDDLAPVAALKMPLAVLAWGGDPSRPLPLARRLAAAARRGRIETVDSLADFAREPGLYAKLLRHLLPE